MYVRGGWRLGLRLYPNTSTHTQIKTTRAHKVIIKDESLAATDVLQNRCSQKCRKFHRKTPVLKSLFNKVVGLRPVTLLKRDSNAGVFRRNILFLTLLFSCSGFRILECVEAGATVFVFSSEYLPLRDILNQCFT